jgi:2-dehydropantoate 2-reductase
MRILILGAGALGGYFGAQLLAAGRDVTFLVRPRTAQQLAERGLRVLSPARGDVFIAKPPTVLADSLHEHFDLILLSSKAYDLAGSMDAIAPAVGPNTYILPMLNGMAHFALLDERFGAEHVLGGTCFISAVRDADGTIRHLNDLDSIIFGDRFAPAGPRLEAVAAALADANFTATLRPRILEDIWNKWSFIATLAGIACLMRASLGDIIATGSVGLTLQLYDECVAIAVAEGYPPTPKAMEGRRAVLTEPGSAMTASMLRDLEDGGPIEAHQIIGDMLAYGRRHRLATPLLEIADAHVRCYEERRRREKAASA